LFTEDGIRIEAFNMAEDIRDRVVNDAGAYNENWERQKDKDPWLESIKMHELELEKKKALRAQNSDESDEDEDKIEEEQYEKDQERL